MFVDGGKNYCWLACVFSPCANQYGLDDFSTQDEHCRQRASAALFRPLSQAFPPQVVQIVKGFPGRLGLTVSLHQITRLFRQLLGSKSSWLRHQSEYRLDLGWHSGLLQILFFQFLRTPLHRLRQRIQHAATQKAQVCRTGDIEKNDHQRLQTFLSRLWKEWAGKSIPFLEGDKEYSQGQTDAFFEDESYPQTWNDVVQLTDERRTCG